MSFRDQVVWITGASSGIGEALAYAVSERGARLIVSARREQKLLEVQAACADPHAHLVLPLDLTDPEAIEPAATAALKHGNRIDILIHNAGLSQRSLAKHTSLEVVRRILETNFFGTVALTVALLPAMLERRVGRFVVVTSLVGKFGTPLRSAYAASKHALHGFFDSLRAEVALTRARMAQEIRAILTPEQQQEIRGWLEQRRAFTQENAARFRARLSEVDE